MSSQSFDSRRAQYMSLAWKDERLIRSLGIAILAGVFLFNLIAYPLSIATSEAPAANLFASFAIWFMLPFVFAIGAAAMLVGTEEENGTLAWMRGLPVKWHYVITSKLVVSAVWLLITWIAATLMLGLQYVLADRIPQQVELDSSFGLLLKVGVAYTYVSFVVLMLGFITSFLFRSPISGIVALFATFPFAIWFLAVVSNMTMNQGVGSTLLLVVSNVMISVALLALIFWLGRRRLCVAESRSRVVDAFASPENAYRPPSQALLSRPSVNAALLWQQIRQTFPIGITSVIVIWIAALAVMVFEIDDWSHRSAAATPFAVIAMALSYTSLGAMTFYGDSVKRQCAFFADRGISPTKVWWTRVVVSAGFLFAAVIPTWACVHVTQRPGIQAYDQAMAVVCLVAGWSIAVFISMLMKRPVLSFFASLVVLSILPGIVAWFFEIYPDYIVTVGAIVPVMMFASWRLCRRWLDGTMDQGFYGRSLGYLAIAIGLPFLFTFSHRYLTLPAMDIQWRESMFAKVPPNVDQVTSLRLDRSWSSELSPMALLTSRDTTYSLATGFSSRDWVKFSANLKRELSGYDPMGTYVSLSEVLEYLNSTSRLNKRDANGTLELDKLSGVEETTNVAVEVLLDWSKRSRQLIVEGREGIATLLRFSEPAEHAALEQLVRMRRKTMTSQNSDTFERLVRLIPSEELRQNSRRTAIIREWALFQKRPWSERFNHGKTFAGTEMLNHRTAWLSVEQSRSERLVDKFTKSALSEIASDQFSKFDVDRASMLNTWLEAQFGPEFRSERGRPASARPVKLLPYSLPEWLDGLDEHQELLDELKAEV
ncbi:ABC-2 family transporter protein [Rubripirellula amarantea]|uniref:ABC-2 family transporter protein n=1 Tax=Rubripirellula amarantea TaxID=2527999 RepID=A0A5C5WMW1_9BACT|nr:ABC transporter permease [Rubripirellula amarantea]TWT51343.1 ABC-2 family transporter protein [Rubripirellula amarantea]